MSKKVSKMGNSSSPTRGEVFLPDFYKIHENIALLCDVMTDTNKIIEIAIDKTLRNQQKRTNFKFIMWMPFRKDFSKDT